MPIQYNGTNSKLESATGNLDSSTTQSLSVSVRVMATGLGEGNFGRIVQAPQDATAGVNSGFFFAHANVANTYQFSPTATGGQKIFQFVAGDSAPHTLQFVYNGQSSANSPLVWVDFSSVSLSVNNLSSGSYVTATSPGFCVGNRTSQDRTFMGDMQDLQVWNVALTSDEIAAAGHRPGSITRGLRLYYPQVNATELRDWSSNGLTGTGTSLATRNVFSNNASNIATLGIGV